MKLPRNMVRLEQRASEFGAKKAIGPLAPGVGGRPKPTGLGLIDLLPKTGGQRAGFRNVTAHTGAVFVTPALYVAGPGEVCPRADGASGFDLVSTGAGEHIRSLTQGDHR